MMYGGSKKKKMMYGGKKMMKDGGKLKMVMKDGKMVPFYAADGKGKMQTGGKANERTGDTLTKKKLTKTFAEEKRKYDPKTGKGKAADKKGEKMQAGGVMDTKLRDVPAKAKKAAKKVVKRVGNATVGDVVFGPVGNKIRKKVKKKMAAKKQKLLPTITNFKKNPDISKRGIKVGGKKKMMMGGKKKMMGGGMKKMYQSGGFIERGTFDLDRDSIL